MAEKVQTRFLTAIQPPKPKLGADYTHQEFPAWRYHETLGGKIVKSQEEADALGPDWGTTPYPEPEKTIPVDLTTAAGQAAANLQLVNRMLEENAKLVERNMQLENLVEQYSPAAAKLKTVEAELHTTKMALKTAQHTIDQIRAGQLAARRISNQANRAAKAGEKPAENESLADALSKEPETAAV